LVFIIGDIPKFGEKYTLSPIFSILEKDLEKLEQKKTKISILKELLEMFLGGVWERLYAYFQKKVYLGFQKTASFLTSLKLFICIFNPL